MKQCSRCKKKKELFEFKKEKRHRDGRTSACRECINKWQREYTKRPEVKARAYEGNFRRHQKRNYNLTLDQRLQMYADQDGRCAICKKMMSYLKIMTDHNHKTGKVRGLLCGHCNLGMSFIDDKEFMKGAKEYGK